MPELQVLYAFRVSQAVAKSFGFAVPPRVNLAIESKTSHARKADKLMKAVSAKASKSGHADYRRFSGHAFSAANPHGKRDENDKRQFVRT